MTSKFFIPAAALAVVALCACSSSNSKKTSDSSTGRTYAQRQNSASTYKTTHRSSFEKEAKQAEGKDRSFKEKSFHTKEYAGKSASDTVDKKFKGKEYAQADKKDTSVDKKDTAMEKSFSGAHDSSRMDTKEFTTSESHLGDKTSQFADKSYSGNSKTFATKSDAATTNAAKKSQKPKIIENNAKPGYTEAEVRAMLNKG